MDSMLGPPTRIYAFRRQVKSLHRDDCNLAYSTLLPVIIRAKPSALSLAQGDRCAYYGEQLRQACNRYSHTIGKGVQISIY